MIVIKPSENDIQRVILDWLEIHKIFHFRNNVGAFKTERGGFYRFGVKGQTDIVCVVNGIYVGVEVKNATGKMKENQEAFRIALTKAGGIYILARSLDDVIEKFKYL